MRGGGGSGKRGRWKGTGAQAPGPEARFLSFKASKKHSARPCPHPRLSVVSNSLLAHRPPQDVIRIPQNPPSPLPLNSLQSFILS